ncbi:MAG TPA: glycosyltransferase family 2 protein [Bryobacteraceae bacterium]|nr:glycosyltransferase family 2 protein [Bryobacteraceae bacterium]
MNRTGVVVVTYNSAEVIERCLDSCGDLPVVVVDNASRDHTSAIVRQRPGVILIANTENRGFAGAVNQGVAALKTELVLSLNPDTELLSRIDELENACGEAGTGLASGKLTDAAGILQRGFAVRRFPTPATLAFEALGINRVFAANPINRRYRCLDFEPDRAAEVEQPPGAFLMFRREVWQRLGGFDTHFHPLWFEDVDFCKRARDLGLKIQYVPQVTARHQGGHSIAGLDWSCREVYWYVSLLKYASKHFRPLEYRGVTAAVMLGSLFRTAVETMRRRSFRPILVYGKIGRLAGRSLISGRVSELLFLSNCSNATQQRQL